MKTLLAALVAATALTAFPAVAEFSADLGVLTCKLKDVQNDIIYSSEKFACEFKPHSGEVQSYTGQIRSLGLDLSVTKDMTLVWAVLAPTADAAAPDALKGTYVGGSASIALGAGAGANILVGGGRNSVTLQPLSASGIVGTGVNIGIEKFELS